MLQGTDLADNSLGGVECIAYHPGSRGVADIVSVTMPLLSIKDLAVCSDDAWSINSDSAEWFYIIHVTHIFILIYIIVSAGGGSIQKCVCVCVCVCVCDVSVCVGGWGGSPFHLLCRWVKNSSKIAYYMLCPWLYYSQLLPCNSSLIQVLSDCRCYYKGGVGFHDICKTSLNLWLLKWHLTSWADQPLSSCNRNSVQSWCMLGLNSMLMEILINSIPSVNSYIGSADMLFILHWFIGTVSIDLWGVNDVSFTHSYQYRIIIYWLGSLEGVQIK